MSCNARKIELLLRDVCSKVEDLAQLCDDCDNDLCTVAAKLWDACTQLPE